MPIWDVLCGAKVRQVPIWVFQAMAQFQHLTSSSSIGRPVLELGTTSCPILACYQYGDINVPVLALDENALCKHWDGAKMGANIYNTSRKCFAKDVKIFKKY